MATLGLRREPDGRPGLRRPGAGGALGVPGLGLAGVRGGLDAPPLSLPAPAPGLFEPPAAPPLLPAPPGRSRRPAGVGEVFGLAPSLTSSRSCLSQSASLS